LNIDVVVQQLISIRQQVDALGSQVDAALSLLVGPQQGEECQHPQDKRKQLGMGSNVWHCEQCGFISQ
jgi:ribosomal protein L37AE/L43A